MNHRRSNNDNIADFYDIYGQTITVRGQKIRDLFTLEYGFFKIAQPIKNDPNIIVEPVAKNRNIEPDIRPIGQKQGIVISDLNTRPILIGYQPGVSGLFISRWVEQLLRWPDKVFAHAGGVAKDGCAHLFFAGGGIGKTSSVINLLKREYEYLSDDWIIIGNGKAYAFPKTIHVFDYNLATNPDLCRRLYGASFPFRQYHQLHLFSRKQLIAKVPGDGFLSRGIRYIGEKVLGGCKLVPLKKINDKARVAQASRLATCLWLDRHSGHNLLVESIEPDELANRIMNIRFHERQRFIAALSQLEASRGGKFYAYEMLDREKHILESNLKSQAARIIRIPTRMKPQDLAEYLHHLLSETTYTQ